MSESRRNRKYSNFKDAKRPMTILAKKDDDSRNNDKQSTSESKPKIILKAKEKEPQPINIVTRDRNEIQRRISVQSKEVKETPQPPIIEQIQITKSTMQKPVDLIGAHYSVNLQSFDHLIDNNSDFLVVAVIGCRGVGKTSILNLFGPLDKSSSFEEKIFQKKEGIFPIRKNYSSLSHAEGIQMFIAKDRTILLDCNPLLNNPFKKEILLNEIDDLKILIFLLSICHVIAVVQEDVLNTNLIRLLQTAEMMKPNIDLNSEEFFSNLIFVKNRSGQSDFQNDFNDKINKMYKKLFNKSKLRIFPGSYSLEESRLMNSPVNTFTFPNVDLNQTVVCNPHPSLETLITELRQQVFMSPRTPMIVNSSSLFTEKNWSQLVISVWDNHKNNFFLRKYESLKDKYNLNNHISIESNTGHKEKSSYLNFIET